MNLESEQKADIAEAAAQASQWQHVKNMTKVTMRRSGPRPVIFEYFKTLSGWYWHERSSNGQVSGGSGQGQRPYYDKYAAKRAAFAHAARTPRAIVRLVDVGYGVAP